MIGEIQSRSIRLLVGGALAVSLLMSPIPVAARADQPVRPAAPGLNSAATQVPGKHAVTEFAPASASLDTSITRYFVEPNGSKTTTYYDAAGYWYKDVDFANMCSDGSAAILMYYWELQHPSNAYPNVTGTYGYFAEPWSSSDWSYLINTLRSYPTFQNSTKATDWIWGQAGTYGRGYMVWLSMVVNPGGTFRFNGIDDYHYRDSGTPVYSQVGNDPDYMVKALAWESSNHANSSQYFWVFVRYDDATLANDFHTAITTDIPTDHVPVQARVSTAYLTNWSGSGQNIGHAISIIGYNDTTGTVTFIDTYGPHQGVFTQSRTSMVNGMTHFPNSSNPHGSPLDGGFVW